MKDSQLQKLVDNAKTTADWKRIYLESDFGSDFERQSREAAAKHAETATTREEWEDIYDISESGSDLEKLARAALDEFEKIVIEMEEDEDDDEDEWEEC